MKTPMKTLACAAVAAIMLPASILLVTALIFSCSSGSNEENQPSSSSKTSNWSSSSYSEEYKTAKVGEQVWLAENLNYNAPNSKCYGEDGKVAIIIGHGDRIYTTLTNDEVQANCDKYGRLYDWATAMALPSSCNFASCEGQINNPHRGICPEGYHIPSNEEWVALYLYVGDSAKLKSTSGWIDHDGSSYPGTDEYGFSALAGGRGWSDGSFDVVGNYGQWWSISEFESFVIVPYMAWYGDIDDHFHKFFDKSQLFSVRCLQDK